MAEARLVVRDPLLDARQQLLGYQFYWQRQVSELVDELEEARAVLLHCRRFAELYESAEEPVQFRYRCYMHAPAELLCEGALLVLPAHLAGVIVTPETLADQQAYEVVKAMEQKGYEIILRGADPTALRPEWLAVSERIEVHFEPGNFTAQARIYALLKNSTMNMIASQVGSWPEYAVCSKLGLSVFAGQFYLAPLPGGTGKHKTLNPAQTTLLRVMEGVQTNADIAKLEELMRHDAGLSYKLLLYINSAAFGLSIEIKSLRHAIQMLGYKNLYRWLCVLFATSDETQTSPALLQAALVRGRLVELLGLRLLSGTDAENLFITGMFSLLDRLLEVNMEEALAYINLPEPVVDVLLGNTGMYKPFLDLARLCEQASGDMNRLVDGTGISCEQINQAHFDAIYWAQRLMN